MEQTWNGFRVVKNVEDDTRIKEASPIVGKIEKAVEALNAVVEELKKDA